MLASDRPFIGLPWKSGGRTRTGLDCIGLSWLWLREQAGIDCPCPKPLKSIPDLPSLAPFNESLLRRGDAVFLQHKTEAEARHVIIYLGSGQYLNILAGCESRVENGLTLLRRLGFEPYGRCPGDDVPGLCAAFADPRLGWATVILIAIAVIAMALSYVLQPSLSGFNRARGRYSKDALYTQTDPELPLPDFLGSVITAGNSIYQQLPDKSATVGATANEAWNQIVVLSSSRNPDISALSATGIGLVNVTLPDGPTGSSYAVNDIIPVPGDPLVASPPSFAKLKVTAIVSNPSQLLSVDIADWGEGYNDNSIIQLPATSPDVGAQIRLNIGAFTIGSIVDVTIIDPGSYATTPSLTSYTINPADFTDGEPAITPSHPGVLTLSWTPSSNAISAVSIDDAGSYNTTPSSDFTVGPGGSSGSGVGGHFTLFFSSSSGGGGTPALKDLYIKGIGWNDPYWHNGSSLEGMICTPPQTKNAAVLGTIYGDLKVPNFTIYNNEPATSIPLDVRASYDRDFPIYPLSGCSKIVFRFFDSSLFGGFNLTARDLGRRMRGFDSSGFVRASATETLTFGDQVDQVNGTSSGNALTARFKLANSDIEAISSLTIGGVAYSEIGPSAQTGNVYHLNKEKGFVEFLIGFPGTVQVTYSYFPRAVSQNPAAQIIYLLTDPIRGRGFDESRIDWASATDLSAYCDEVITWVGTDFATAGPRFVSNYAVDDRKPIQDHLAELQHNCNALVYFSAGKWFLRARKASDSSVFSFDPSNIMVDSSRESAFEATLSDRTSKINRAKLFYHSDLTLQSETEVICDDEDNQNARAPRIGNDGVVEDSLKFPSVTTGDQAERLALMIVTEQVNSNWVYKWTTNIKGLALQPGDIVDVTHPCLPGGSKNLRIDLLEYDEADHLAITASEFVPAACI